MRKEQTFDSFDVLYIELTGDCNFGCVHCGNEDSRSIGLDLDLVEKVLKEFEKVGGKKLVLTGGEPLLHPDIQEILDIAAGHSYNTKLSTNAYLLNSPEFGFVLDHDLGFRVSLDGTEETHDDIRGIPGAYENLIAAMEKMSERGRQIIIRTTVMKQNKNCIVDMLSELDRLTKSGSISIYSNNIWPMRHIGKADPDLMLTASEYKDFLKSLNHGTRDFRPSFRIIVGPTFGLEKEFEGGPIQSNQIYTCDMLNTSLHIAHTGDIYPCSFVHHSFGNIADIPLTKVFRDKESVRFRDTFLDRDNHDCDECKSYDVCKAGCVAEVYTKMFGEDGGKVRDVYCFRGGCSDS